MSSVTVITGIARPPVQLDCLSGGDLVVAFPRGISQEEAPPVCVGASQNNFSIEFPPGSAASFSVELPVEGSLGGAPFELPAGRLQNPVVSFPSGGKIAVTTVATGGRRFTNVAITSTGGQGASMDPLPASMDSLPGRE